METENIHFAVSVRHLVTQYSQDELERCIDDQINTSSNPCFQGMNGDAVISLLSKAGFVRTLMADGLSTNDALRELGKRMRVFNQ